MTLVVGMRDGTEKEGWAVSKIENPNLSSLIWIGREPWPPPQLMLYGFSWMCMCMCVMVVGGLYQHESFWKGYAE